jgi:hypothetical protein
MLRQTCTGSMSELNSTVKFYCIPLYREKIVIHTHDSWQGIAVINVCTVVWMSALGKRLRVCSTWVQLRHLWDPFERLPHTPLYHTSYSIGWGLTVYCLCPSWTALSVKCKYIWSMYVLFGHMYYHCNCLVPIGEISSEKGLLVTFYLFYSWKGCLLYSWFVYCIAGK